jgi:hypothetical protein
LRDTPEWIEVTKYAAPGNFMLGEIGRLNDVVFIETTQIGAPVGVDAADLYAILPGGNTTSTNPLNPDWRGNMLGEATTPNDPYPNLGWPSETQGTPGADGTLLGAGTAAADYPAGSINTYPAATLTPSWGAPWGPAAGVAYEALMLGDNAFGHAISLPVELRDGGVLDFGREHALAWYSIWGWGVVTESSVVKIVTN